MKRIITATILVLILLSIFTIPAYATDEPDSVSLSGIRVFQDLIVTDDFLAVVPYDIPFTVLPDENIDELFIFRMLDPDDYSEIGSVTAYPYHDQGFGQGCVSFYFETEATWLEDYIFRVQENPTYYTDALYWDFSISASNYATDSDQAEALRSKVLDLANTLAIEFSLGLVSTGEAGQTVLSTYGEIYFQNAIPGLASISPGLFSLQIRTPDYTKRSWDYTVADAMRTKYDGTFLADFMTGWGGLFNVEVPFAMNVLCIILFAIMVFVSVKWGKGTTYSGLMDGYAFMIFLMLSGFFSMILTGFFAFLLIATGGVLWLLNRS